MKVYEKKNFPRTARDFKSMMEKGTLSFDNAVQRSFVWQNTPKDNRMSMLIDTMLRGFCVPPMYCNCLFSTPKDKVYDFIDGKQRVMTVIKYLNDEFPLIGIPTFTLEDDTELDLNGKRFSELPEDFQENVKLFSFTVNYYENMEQDDVEELFRRLNNGRSLTAIELTRATAKSKNQIRELAAHPLMGTALNEKGIARYDNEDIAIKSWIVLYGDVKSFETSNVRPTMRDTDISNEELEHIQLCFDWILDAYNCIKNQNDKVGNRVCKKMLKKTHLLSLLCIANHAIDKNISGEDAKDWLVEFFGCAKGTSISDTYNENAKAGSAKTEAINQRECALKESFARYFENVNK